MNVSNAGSDCWDMVKALGLEVRSKHDTIGVQSRLSTTQSCITVSAQGDLDDSNRATVDIMVALDLSSSMYGTKLALCKTSLEILLRQLTSKDKFGLVSFSDEAVLEIPLARLTAEHRTVALDKIKQLEVTGCTNISAAIATAVSMMQMAESPSEVRAMFLLTDGHATSGIIDHRELVQLTRNWLTGSLSASKEGSPIAIHCFGYGSNHDSKLLKGMAQCSEGGTYYFAEKDSSVMTAIGDALGGVLSVVAQGTMLHLSVPPEAKESGVEILKIHHNKAVKNGDGSYTISIGDFYAEETRDLLFDFKLSRSMSTAPLPHVEAYVSYADTLLKCPVRQGPVVCVVARPPGIEVAPVDQHVLLQGLRVRTAEQLAVADVQSTAGDLEGARNTIQAAVRSIRAERSVQSAPLVGQLIEDLSLVDRGLTSHDEYRAHGGHFMRSAVYSHTQQRCVDSIPRSSNTYRSDGKSKKAKLFLSCSSLKPV